MSDFSVPPEMRWRKSSFSTSVECVELGDLPSDDIAVRNSNFPERGALVFTRNELRAFILGAKAGEFDDLA